MDKDKCLPKLTQNFLEILEDDEYYDITIEVVLSKNRKKNDETLVHVTFPNLSPEIFQIILRYIYGGRLSLDGFDDSEIFKTLIVANELDLQELIPYLQSILIENKENWSNENLNLIYQTSLESDSYLELKNVCTVLISNEPGKFFESPYFNSVPKETLISLIQSDNLKMSAVQVWNYVLKWGLAQNPNLSSDLSSYSQDDFNSLRDSLQEFFPLIEFLRFTPKELLDKIYPYKRIIPEGLFESTIISLLRNCGESEVESRNINIEPKKVNIESSIITYRHAELITKWIEKLEITDEITASYEFKLLSRSQGGDVRFSSKFPTITIIKVKGTDEILGGYSPIAWPRGTIFYSVFTYRTSKDSFIFSFEDIIDINSHILSRVKNEQHAIAFHFFSHYFSFGITDLSIGSSYGSCQMNDYEKPIRETVDNFEIEICEIFLITKINGND